jgi:hypothetical protein
MGNRLKRFNNWCDNLNYGIKFFILMPIFLVIGALDAILPPILSQLIWAIGLSVLLFFVKGEVKKLINYPFKLRGRKRAPGPVIDETACLSGKVPDKNYAPHSAGGIYTAALEREQEINQSMIQFSSSVSETKDRKVMLADYRFDEKDWGIGYEIE